MLHEHADAIGVYRVRRPLVIGLLALISFVLITGARPNAASADIPWPYQFMPYIDAYAEYDPGDGCSPTAKPGVVGFRDLLNFWFGQHATWGIVHACTPATGEHEEGRALDYNVDARTDAGRIDGLRIINWLTESDEYGNRLARARRFGIMYIQWNSRIFRMYGPKRGQWEYDSNRALDGNKCDGINDPVTFCHLDHMHLSFSWAGANKQTTWWTTTQQTRSGCGSTIQTWTYPTAFGPLVQVKRIQDVYGSDFDSQSEIRDSYWRVEAAGHVYRANQPLSLFATGPRSRARVQDVFGGGYCYVYLV